jgi:hypothetical protein
VADGASLSIRGVRLSLESIADENFRKGVPQRRFAIAGEEPRECPSNSAAIVSPEKKLTSRRMTPAEYNNEQLVRFRRRAVRAMET